MNRRIIPIIPLGVHRIQYIYMCMNKIHTFYSVRYVMCQQFVNTHSKMSKNTHITWYMEAFLFFIDRSVYCGCCCFSLFLFVYFILFRFILNSIYHHHRLKFHRKMVFRWCSSSSLSWSILLFSFNRLLNEIELIQFSFHLNTNQLFIQLIKWNLLNKITVNYNNEPINK